jgi:endonuclease/exonuclease/phosphatase family metal-dependent hydrolase
MTFNIQSAVRGMDGWGGAIRSASPDIVALQEVGRGLHARAGQNQPAVMAERTGLPYHAHFRTTDLFGGAYGVALLSRFPLLSVKQYPLPVTPATSRARWRTC